MSSCELGARDADAKVLATFSSHNDVDAVAVDDIAVESLLLDYQELYAFVI